MQTLSLRLSKKKKNYEKNADLLAIDSDLMITFACKLILLVAFTEFDIYSYVNNEINCLLGF